MIDEPAMRIHESVLIIEARDEKRGDGQLGAGGAMIGVLAQPAAPEFTRPIGVVVVVGGPQTRVGSHRQFVLLARALACAGYACLRFDYSGMGDSPGPKPDFEEAGLDIARACDALLAAVPACRRIALWGLCDGATAALFYAENDDRIAAVIAANPWARSDSTRSAAIVDQHYGSRLRSRNFWVRVATGKVNVVASLKEALRHAWQASRSGKPSEGGSDQSLPGRVARALEAPRATCRLQLSGNDLTAAEFEIAMRPTRVLERGPATLLRLKGADHTFSDPAKWQSVIDDTSALLAGLSR